MDSSDVTALGGNPAADDVMSAWGFLVDAVNWTGSAANASSLQTTDMTTSGVEATASQAGVWTAGVVFRVTSISVLMLLTLVGNVSLIAILASQAALRRKRVSVFLLNLAVCDLMVCLVTMSTEIFFVAFGEWVLGAVACKLIVYGQIVTLASSTFLLTAMSIDRYQVHCCIHITVFSRISNFGVSMESRCGGGSTSIVDNVY